MRLPILALLGLLLCAACGADPTPTPIAPVTLTGTGTTDSARFALPAGDYLAQWTAGGTACQFGATLAGENAAVPRQIGYQAGANPARLAGLPAGTYYWIISSRCPWTLLIQPAH